MKKLKNAIAVLLGLFSIYMAFKGLTVFVITEGQVTGSEFGMSITLANRVGLLMAWLALFAVLCITPSNRETA